MENLGLMSVVCVFGLAAGMLVLSAACVLIGVVIGGQMVFRSAAPHSGSLFHFETDTKDAVTEVDDGIGETTFEETPSDVMDQNERFRAIFGAEKHL